MQTETVLTDQLSKTVAAKIPFCKFAKGDLFVLLFFWVKAVSQLNSAVKDDVFFRAVFVGAEISVSHKLESVAGISICKALFAVRRNGLERIRVKIILERRNAFFIAWVGHIEKSFVKSYFRFHIVFCGYPVNRTFRPSGLSPPKVAGSYVQ